MSNEVKKVENDVTSKSITKSVMSPVKDLLNMFRKDYLDETTTQRDLFGSIESYKAYTHLQHELNGLLDYFKQHEASLEDWDISIMENYIDLMLDIVNPRVVLLDNKIKELKEEKE